MFGRVDHPNDAFVHHLTLASAAPRFQNLVNFGSDNDRLWWGELEAYGIEAPERLVFTGEYRDTRPPHSAPHSGYMDYAIRVSTCSAPLRVVVHSSAPYHAPCRGADPVYPCSHATVPVSHRLSVWWTVDRFDFDGVLVHAYTHAHRIAEAAILAWSMDPEAVGLGAPPARPLELNGTLDALLSRTRAPPSCSSRRPTYAWAGSDGFACRPWAFRAGEARTLLCAASVPDSVAAEWIGYHCTAYMYAAVTAARPAAS